MVTTGPKSFLEGTNLQFLSFGIGVIEILCFFLVNSFYHIFNSIHAGLNLKQMDFHKKSERKVINDKYQFAQHLLPPAALKTCNYLKLSDVIFFLVVT